VNFIISLGLMGVHASGFATRPARSKKCERHERNDIPFAQYKPILVQRVVRWGPGPSVAPEAPIGHTYIDRTGAQASASFSPCPSNNIPTMVYSDLIEINIPI
jgi:hypothetical protein